jgi:hypothetical protein
MVLLSLEESRRTRSSVVPELSPPVQPDQPGPQATAEQVWVETLRAEIDTYLCGLRQLGSRPPEQVFTYLSGVSARLVEIRTQLWRSDSRRCAALRSREIDPLLEEVDRQFRFHSRIAAMVELEWQMTRAAPS